MGKIFASPGVTSDNDKTTGRTTSNPLDFKVVGKKIPSLEHFQNKKMLDKIVWQNHQQAIAAACTKGNYTIAIRETGPASIKRIAEGAKAKPHIILEKTIKISSLESGYGIRAPIVLEQLHKMNLVGFVGHWDNNKKLLGVRVSETDVKAKKITAIHVQGTDTYYIPVDFDRADGGHSLNNFRLATTKWSQYLYTGDYDIHEAYASIGGGGGQIPEATEAKRNMLNSLNKGISQSGDHSKVRTGKAELTGSPKLLHVKGEYAMFQHGDQATYKMNQHLEAERTGAHGSWGHGYEPKLVHAVATESEEPLAWFIKGEWYVTENKKEHQTIREIFHLIKPSNWSKE